MQKVIERWWIVWIGLILASILAWGVQQMYFHQDDLDWFILANRPFVEVLRAPIGDHINYLWRLLLALEWSVFGLSFPGYMTVSIGLHGLAIWLLYTIAYETSRRQDLAVMAALLFTINTNWTETILWTSGQTISITALCVLLAVRQVWRRRGEASTIVLACLTSALALGLPIATLVVFKNQRWRMGIILVLVAATYLWSGGDGTRVEMSPAWVGQVLAVWGLMPINSVLGRLIIPFDRLEIVRIVLVVAMIVYGAWRLRGRLSGLWSDIWIRFLCYHTAFYYLVVAVGRAQYGVGIMRAERYAYLGLALLLLLMVRALRGWHLGRWIWAVPVVVLTQSVGLLHRANQYIVRPQQLKSVVEQVIRHPRSVNPDAYLPHHVLNDERLTYRDLLSLIHDD